VAKPNAEAVQTKNKQKGTLKPKQKEKRPGRPAK
jgi:hypothetical protein